jgi:hypothetical protein
MNHGEFDEMRRGLPRRLTPEQVADLLGKTTRTLRLWRKSGFGPEHVRIGKKSIKYDEPVVLAWLAQQHALGERRACPTCGARAAHVRPAEAKENAREPD